MEKITSRNNPKIKYACSLKNARETAFVLAEGLRLCRDAAENGIAISTCFLTEKMYQSGECAAILEASQASFLIEQSVSEKLAETKNPQGIFCICQKPQLSCEIDSSGKYLLLEQVRDPGNFGTMVRTAEAFGLSGILACDCCDAFSAKAMRASMGAVFRFPVIEIEQEEAFLRDIVGKGMNLYCAVVESAAADVGTLARQQGIITAVGNEANGLSRETLALGTPVTIHMAGRAESFNVSQAATVIMYEMAK